MLLDMLNTRAKGKCPFCNKDMKDAEFKDALSRKEFGISGICQECQDKVFAEPVDFVDEEPKQCNDGCRNGTLHRDQYYCCGKCGL